MSEAKQLGVVRAATEHEGLTKLLRRCLALRFMPDTHIQPVFEILHGSSRRYEENHPIHGFIAYLGRQWVESTLFPTSAWSQFGVRVRTNNDLEGWHRQFNVYMGARPHLYSFACKVAQEADATRDKIVAKDFQRRSCEATTQRERRLENITEKYLRREITASTMLDRVANVYGY